MDFGRKPLPPLDPQDANEGQKVRGAPSRVELQRELANLEVEVLVLHHQRQAELRLAQKGLVRVGHIAGQCACCRGQER